MSTSTRPGPRRPSSRRWRALAAAVAVSLLTLLAMPADAAPQPTYTNPVSSSFADTYADPAVIHGKDGWWYAYATADPLRSGGPSALGHIARTRDWVNWDYVGPIFTNDTRPTWATADAGLWAPDIRYIQGRYVMYFTVTDTTLNPGGDSAIGVATSDSPAGPFIPTDAPIIAPRGPGAGNYFWTFDPSGFTDTDGNQYLYWGSYYGGVHVTRTTPDGLSVVGEPTQVGAWDRYEGSYVVEHDGWYYLMASSANCCAGPSTGYSVFVGRSRSPMGPFLDKEGRDMNASVTGGTLVVTQNGNTWIGAGHNAMFTDAAGRDWLLYHAIDRNQPWLNEPFGINRRPMLTDRVDWINGWPVVNAGAGPSDDPMPAPLTSSLLTATPWDPAGGITRAQRVTDPQGGDVARISGTSSTSDVPSGDFRLRFDLKSDEALNVFVGEHNQVKVVVDPEQHLLTVKAGGQTATDTLPSMTGWTTVTVELDKGRLTASVSMEDLSDPAAIVRLDLPGTTLRTGPVRFIGQALVDNLTVARPAVEATALTPQPSPGALLFTDNFTGQVDPSWTWVRPQSDTRVSDGQLLWPLKAVDIVGGGNTGALLLRDAPEGDWIATVKFTLDLGSGTNDRNYQQAGLVVHNTDDDFARLGSVSIWGTRTVEYGREVAAAPDGRTTWGGAIIGASNPTMYLRIAHHQQPNGERLYRAGISHDGVHWIWGATWTFPAGTTPRIGLYAGGGDQFNTVASFDWFTLSTATNQPGTWPAP